MEYDSLGKLVTKVLTKHGRMDLLTECMTPVSRSVTVTLPKIMWKGLETSPDINHAISDGFYSLLAEDPVLYSMLLTIGIYSILAEQSSEQVPQGHESGGQDNQDGQTGP